MSTHQVQRLVIVWFWNGNAAWIARIPGLAPDFDASIAVVII